jgi:DNA invertase Pin-like site-specific DNA recombinase
MIVMARLDGAFRSAVDALGTLEELKADGIGLHLIDLGGDVCGNGISKLVFTILSAVAEYERDRIREVKRHLASQGIYGGGKRPFGWHIVENGGKKRLVSYPHELAAMKRRWELRSEGKTLRAIARMIAAEFNMPEFAAITVKRILDRDIRVVERMVELEKEEAARAAATTSEAQGHSTVIPFAPTGR